MAGAEATAEKRQIRDHMAAMHGALKQLTDRVENMGAQGFHPPQMVAPAHLPPPPQQETVVIEPRPVATRDVAGPSTLGGAPASPTQPARISDLFGE